MFNKWILLAVGIVLLVYSLIIVPPIEINIIRGPMITAGIILIALFSAHIDWDILRADRGLCREADVPDTMEELQEKLLQTQNELWELRNLIMVTPSAYMEETMKKWKAEEKEKASDNR